MADYTQRGGIVTAMSLQIYDETTPIIGGHSYLIADGTTPINVLQAGYKGGRCDNALCGNYGAADVSMILFVTVGGSNIALAAITVPAGSGAAGVAPVDLIAKLGTLAASGLVLPTLGILYAAPSVAVTADNSLVVVTLGGSF